MPTITDLLFGNGMSSMAPGSGGGMSSIQSMLQSLQGGMNPLARAGGMQQAQDANPGTPFDPWAASRAMAANPGVTADGPNVNSANPSFIGTPGASMPFYMGGGTAGGGMGQPKPMNAGPAGGNMGGTDWSNLWMQIMSGMGGMGGGGMQGGMQGGMGDSMPILQAIRSAMGRMPGTAPGNSMGGSINSLMRYR